MIGGDAYKAKLLTADALDAAIAAYLADPSKPAVREIDGRRLDVAAAVRANAYSTEVLAREGVTARRSGTR
ncbi:hypothetical protein [Methylobacterium nonmethylotrophicum]|uniref:Uncharacterized protein n=1 Tax=Methylobacterium nonmethylotrophicum TaxID=1141884 RepID=A0A4Z0NR43_9HYPH|nr:hypothetical protein [Methylobacterium nonmethylotrophicum]TGD99319.1 hypothetical protein EU555_12415 [Methylobacterium nonmethylotrophicum]